jgi:hypothetical protein
MLKRPQVENRLFKVYRHYFMKSDVFQTTFNLPKPEGDEGEGHGDEHPFVLHGIKKDDFEALLKVIYPL